MELKVAVVAHGLGITSAYSGEGKIYQTFFEMLYERGVSYVALSFAKPRIKIENAVYILPFSLPKFDKYQRILVYFSAKKVRPKVYLNASGVPIPLSHIAPHVIYAGAPSIANLPSKYTSSVFWKLYLLPFKTIVSKFKDEAKRAVFIANSKYSARAISEVYGIPVPKVVYPPVDFEDYSKAFGDKSERAFLTIARFERGKMIENSIIVSAKSGVKGYIVGSLIEKGYYKRLEKLKKELNANVEFYPNLPKEKLIELMNKIPVYFHPTIGEHFGLPVIEAMSAGLIPVVPKESGAYEVVPEFAYSNIDEAVVKLKEALESNMREEMRRRALRFNRKAFKEEIFNEISKFL